MSAAFDVVHLTALRADPAFSQIDGRLPDQTRIGVAVIDSGLFASHPDLQGNFVAWFDAVANGGNSTAVAGPGSTNPAQAFDPNGHGSHVAGTVASSNPAIGVAPRAGLIGVRWAQAPGETDPFHEPVLAGLNWVLNNHARYNIRVVNMSMGNWVNYNTLPPVDDWSRMIDKLEAAGITVVAATGNSYAHFHALGASTPAAYASLSVANTWEDRGIGDSFPLSGGGSFDIIRSVHLIPPSVDDLAASSQRSTLPNQVAAPGSTIYSTWNGAGGKLYSTEFGTSMASPLVAGMVALMQDAAVTFGGRYLTVSEVVDIARSTADEIEDDPDLSTRRVMLGLPDLLETGEFFLRVNIREAVRAVRELVTMSTDNTIANPIVLPALDATNQVRSRSNIGTDGEIQIGDDDVDLYRLEVKSPGNLSVALTRPPAGTAFSPVLRLFNSAGTQLDIEYDVNGVQFPTLVSGQLVIGTYYVGVSSLENRTYNVVTGSGIKSGESSGDYELIATLGNPDPNGVPQGALNIDLTSPNAFNPNQNLVNAGVYVANRVQGSAETDPNPLDPTGPRITIGPTDVDFYRVVAPDTGYWIIDVNARDVLGAQGIDSYIRVFDTNWVQMGQNDNQAANLRDSYLEVQVQAGATYYVAVTTFDNRQFDPLNPFNRSTPNGEVGLYDLYLSFYNGDVNGTAFGAVAAQSQLGGVIGSDQQVPLLSVPTNGGFKDVDFFSLQASQNALLEVKVTSPDSTLIPNVKLWEFSAAQNAIFPLTEVEGASATILHVVSPGQFLYVSVTGQGNGNFKWVAPASGPGGDVGNYLAQFTLLNSGQVAQLADDSISLHTPQPIEVNEVVEGSIGKDGNLVRGAADVDIYRFIPSLSGRYSVRASKLGALGADTYLRVFNSSGGQVAANDDANEATTNSNLILNFVAGQTYYIGVNGSNAQAATYNPINGAGAVAGSSGSYSILVSQLSPGDFNNNGSVDAADYVLWRNTLGTPVPPGTAADGDGDGTVDQDDYAIWRANYGNSFAASSALSGMQFRRAHASQEAHGASLVEQISDVPTRGVITALADAPSRPRRGSESTFCTETAVRVGTPTNLLLVTNRFPARSKERVESAISRLQDPWSSTHDEGDTNRDALDAVFADVARNGFENRAGQSVPGLHFMR